jgi:hypothetical protein
VVSNGINKYETNNNVLDGPLSPTGFPFMVECSAPTWSRSTFDQDCAGVLHEIEGALEVRMNIREGVED